MSKIDNRLRSFTRKLNYTGFLKRVGIVFLIFSVAYLPYFFIQQHQAKNQKAPLSKSSIRVDLNQHLIALQSLRDIDTKDISSTVRIEGLRSSIDTTRENYRKNLAAYKKKDGAIVPPNAEEFFAQEELILKKYDQNYKELKKVIQYSPDKDLNSLNLASDLAEVATRIDIATQALTNIKNQSSAISDQTKQYIDRSIACLNDIQKQARDNQADTLDEHIRSCDTTYTSARLSAITDVTQPLRTTNSEDLFGQIRDLINKF